MRPLCCITAALLFVAALSARADNVETFDVSGTFTDSTTVSGTVVIDTTTGVFESGNLTYLGMTFDNLYDADSQPPDLYQFVLTETAAGGAPLLNMGIVGDSLVGFNGGPLCSEDELCNGDTSAYAPDDFNILYLENGTVTAVASSTPEPTTVALLGTGFLGLAIVVRRRFIS